MRFLLCPDSFKSSLSAEKVCEALSLGILAADKRHEVTACPLADGGEGTARLLARHFGAREIICEALDPLFRPVKASYYLDEPQTTAYIEMAAASGYERLKHEERSAVKTSTFGTGELIADAIAKGANKIVLCLGGSATNDGGIGMASALGWQFLNAVGERLVPTGENLHHIAQIIAPQKPIYTQIQIVAATDVQNPLHGKNGAAYMFAPQKGATMQEVNSLDQGLRNLETQAQKIGIGADATQQGSGAAGGLGFGATAFLNANLVWGIDFVLNTLNFDALLQAADVVITGEGKLDAQSLHGKVIAGVATRCAQFKKPLLAVCGTFDLTPEAQKRLGLRFASSCLSAPMTLPMAIQRTPELLKRWGFNVATLLG